MERHLPNNWVKAEFKDLTSFVIGGDWGKDLEFEFDVDSEIVSCIRGSEIKNWGQDKGSTASIRKIKSSSLEKRALVEGDILLEISGGGPDQPVGRTIYIDEEALEVNADYKKVCTNFLRMVRLYDVLNKKFIKHYLDSFYLSGEILKYQGGSNNLRNLKYKEFETIKIPLPPLPEQQRIVAKLDALFGHLDTLKTRLENIPQILKNFRQAVLTQAVTGKLTEEWGVGKELEDIKLNDSKKYELGFEFSVPKKWSIYPIGNVFSFQQGMQIAKETRLKSPGNNVLPILRIKNYHDGFIEDVEYIKINEKSLIAEEEDIILTRTGESRGRVLTGFKGVFHNNTFRINFPKDKVEGKYLKHFLSQSQIQAFIKYNSGRTGQPDLTHKSFGPCPFILPPKEEQTEIVKRVEHLFSKADAIEAQYQSLKTKIDSLPQAILAKAFKGELVEQLPTDGDAKDLLEEIKRLRESMKKKTVKKKPKKK